MPTTPSAPGATTMSTASSDSTSRSAVTICTRSGMTLLCSIAVDRWLPLPLSMRWLPPLAVTLLAAAVRFYRIDTQSLWYDEGISAHQLTRSFPEILRAAALDTHPPLYYWTLKAWGSLLGDSELGLRSLSAVARVAMVLLNVLVGR